MKSYLVEVDEEQIEDLEAENIEDAIETFIKIADLEKVNFGVSKVSDHLAYINIYLYQVDICYEIGEEGY